MVDDIFLRCSTESLESLGEMQKALDAEKIDFGNTISKAVQNVPSNLDGMDLAFCVICGVVGTIVNNQQNIKEFLNGIHDKSNIKNPKGFFEKILQHSGHHMDKIPLPDGSTGFVNRLATDNAGIFVGPTVGGNPHRIMWGHDILSFKSDNPLFLSLNQYGFFGGITKASRHLIADTCSKQGLPMPTHSWFDYKMIKSDGSLTLGNRLIDVCRTINTEVGISNKGQVFNIDSFNQLFSVRMQDVMAKGLTFALAKTYIYARGIKNETRKIQIHLLSTFVNFFGTTIWGIVKTGIPIINWIALGSLVKLTSQLYIHSYRETIALERITASIVESNVELEKRVLATGQSLPTYTNPWDYVDDYLNEQKSTAGLISFFDEED